MPTIWKGNINIYLTYKKVSNLQCFDAVLQVVNNFPNYSVEYVALCSEKITTIKTTTPNIGLYQKQKNVAQIYHLSKQSTNILHNPNANAAQILIIQTY